MSSFGRVFKVSTFGESHCKGVGCIVDGVPPRMRLTEADIQPQLSRRRPGQSALTTKRNEVDAVTILSGTECGVTLGTPIAMLVSNQDQRPNDYNEMNDVPRPSHADYTYQVKYGVRASSGGGRSSARETIGRVAAGAIAEKWLKEMYGTEIVAWTSSVHTITAPRELESQPITREQVDQSLVRCPHEETTQAMIRAIEEARDAQDSIGGVVTCVIRQVPAGLGEPVFDKLEALLAHAMLSIPATKGFEIGSGFEGTKLRGSQHNDAFVASPSPSPSEENKAASSPAPADYANVRLRTATNNSGGVQGGISNGENIVFRVAFKPPATIGVAQDTTDYWGNPSTLEAKGRHDPCVVPRAIAIVEAMAALVIADAALLQLSREACAEKYPFIGNAKRAPTVFGDVPEEPSAAAAAPPTETSKKNPSTDDSRKLM